MRQRGRQSSASLSVVSLTSHGRRRIKPPADLDAIDAKLFTEIVAACPADHFAPGDASLLATYCQAVRLSRCAAETAGMDGTHVASWEKLARVVASLAVKLRLCPHSRTDPKTTGRRTAEYRPSFYDTMETDDEWK
jgi:phage terminase small subunit